MCWGCVSPRVRQAVGFGVRRAAWIKVSSMKGAVAALLYRPGYEYRKTCRDRLAESDNPIIVALLAAERPQFSWEGPELTVSEQVQIVTKMFSDRYTAFPSSHRSDFSHLFERFWRFKEPLTDSDDF